MNAVTHDITHYYQPTNNTCGYAALAILLSHYDKSGVTPQEVVAAVPQPTDNEGKPVGSITAQLATWCLNEGYSIDLYSFDCQILDLSWAGLDSAKLIERLEAVKNVRDVPGLGEKYWSKIYAQAYIDMLQAGGTLTIQAHPTSKLLYKLLETNPIYANFCSATVNNRGRKTYPDAPEGERVSSPDDVHGTIGTHSVVIFGNDEEGNFLVADPWDGVRTIDLETMLCGISAAQIECDNMLFQMSPKS